MFRGSFQAAFAVLLFISASQASSGGVSFWRENFTMTCPEVGTWFNKANKDLGIYKELELKYENDRRGRYHCEYGEKRYYFYVQGKVCGDCFELDALLFGLVITVDIFITALVMTMIYRCAKRKSSAGPVHPSKAPVRGPPVPSPDYEYPNRNTMSRDIYSKMNGTG